jgi:flagellar protein FliO/FliZ
MSWARHCCWLAAVPALPAFAAAEQAVRLTESPFSSGHLLETAGGLLLVLALIIGLAWGVKRVGRVPGTGKGGVQVLGGISLGPRERAVLLSVEGTRLLVGVAPGRVQTLHVLDEAPEAAVDAASDAFARDLQQAVNQGANP